MTNYLLRHLQVLFYTLGQMARAPFASLMTVAVIGITLALPTGLYVLINNVSHLSAGWDSGAQISLFLKKDVSDDQAQRLAATLRGEPGVGTIDYLSHEAALAEFKRLSGFGPALDALGYNPLPAVLVVHPAAGYRRPAAVQALADRLSRRPQVDFAQLDLAWVERLDALLAAARRGVGLLAGLLGLAVVLITGNTIRLAVLNRRDEIEVVGLIGGTAAFIRRPFLYTGLIQGLLGAAAAWLLIAGSLAVVGGPLRELTHLYGSDFRLLGLGLGPAGVLLASGAVLGWLGARIAVGRHLRALEPS